MYKTDKKKQNGMKVVIFLFLVFAPTAHSRHHSSKFYNNAKNFFKSLPTTTFCSIGRLIESDSTQLNKLCSKIHDFGTNLPRIGSLRDSLGNLAGNLTGGLSKKPSKAIPFNPLSGGLSKKLSKAIPFNPLSDVPGINLAKTIPVQTFTDKLAAMTLEFACVKPAEFMKAFSKLFTKYCKEETLTTKDAENTQSMPNNVPTTQSTAKQAPTTPSTPTEAPTTQSTPQQAPTTRKPHKQEPTTQSTMKQAPTTSSTTKQAPSTQSTLPEAPTTQSTPQPRPTPRRTRRARRTTNAPDACKKFYADRCEQNCKDLRRFQLNLGSICIQNPRSISCKCKPVTHCESYKNATCEEQCQKYKGGICRIPDEGYPCVCQFKSENTDYYRLPQ